MRRTFLAPPAPPAGRCWDLQGPSQNKAATVTGASLLAAWNCTMLVVLHTDAERKQEQMRCSVTVCAEVSFQLCHLCSLLCSSRRRVDRGFMPACLPCLKVCVCTCVWVAGALGGQRRGRNRDVIFIRDCCNLYKTGHILYMEPSLSIQEVLNGNDQ